jgi:ABC-type nitrate/sulfonate/bicarbonate transport system permease component
MKIVKRFAAVAITAALLGNATNGFAQEYGDGIGYMDSQASPSLAPEIVFPVIVAVALLAFLIEDSHGGSSHIHGQH